MSLRERITKFLEGEPETLMVFPTYGSVNPATDMLVIPISAWVFEWETASRSRRAIVETLRRLVKVDLDSPEADVFVRRIAPFLVDNERGETLVARVGDHEFTIGTSEANGRIDGEIVIPIAQLADLVTEHDGRESLRVTFSVDGTEIERDIPIIGASGLTVISDIDDTIKMTSVLDHNEMLRNTFLRPFKAVPSAADKYRALADQGAQFHYVSAAPWQLLPFLQEFIERAGFPPGTFHLRTLRIKSASSPLAFIKSSREYKTNTIAEIIGSFPDRQFILIGDSGERDPEVYGDIARIFPDQIEQIWIRLVEGAKNEKERFEEAFVELAEDIWRTDWFD